WRVGVGPSLVLLAPAVVAFGIYGLVLVEGRYVAPFVVLLVLGLLTLVRARNSATAARISGLIALVLVFQIGSTLVDPARALLSQPVRVVVASAWPAQTGDPGWIPIDATDYFYHVVSPRP